MPIGDRPVGPVHSHFVPVAHPGHQFDPQQVGQPKDHLRLSLRIGVDRIRLEDRLVLEQSVQDVDCFPDPTGDEVAE